MTSECAFPNRFFSYVHCFSERVMRHPLLLPARDKQQKARLTLLIFFCNARERYPTHPLNELKATPPPPPLATVQSKDRAALHRESSLTFFFAAPPRKLCRPTSDKGNTLDNIFLTFGHGPPLQYFYFISLSKRAIVSRRETNISMEDCPLSLSRSFVPCVHLSPLPAPPLNPSRPWPSSGRGDRGLPPLPLFLPFLPRDVPLSPLS